MPPVTPQSDSTAVLRDRLTSMQGLLVLSMLMTESDDEQRILYLAATSVPSLGRCRLAGVYLTEAGWRMTQGACADAQTRADIEAQFAVLSSAGGAVTIMGEAWGWAFSLRSLEGHLGFLLVGAQEPPPLAEQFLLRVLAQQTGIALINARLHARERAIAAELRATNAALAATVTALERSTAIHARLTRVAVAGEGQEGIARAVHELTGYPVAVEDRHGTLRAWAGPPLPHPYPQDPPALRERLLQRAQAEGRPIREGERLIALARPGGDVLGVLVLIDSDKSAGEAEETALEHGATVLAMELARLRSLAETELRLGRDLVEELLAGTEAAHVLTRARALGHDLQRPHRVVVIESPGLGREDDTLFHAVRRAARDKGVGSLLVPRPQGVVVLAHAERCWQEFCLEVRARLGGGRCRIGVGGSCLDPAGFPRSYREAKLALRMQDLAGSGDRVTVFDRLGVYRLLGDVQEGAGIEGFVREWLGALIDYDADKRTELLVTLSRYLECGGSYGAACKALVVHRSTLKYRLQRIRQISGHDLADAETRFNLQLATRAWQTLRALRSEQP
jgi:sugar diacid utilization regulator